MKQITTIENQTIFDIAIQEYGNVELAFQILTDNPQLSGLNDFPVGHNVIDGVNFDVSFPIKKDTVINIQDTIAGENKAVSKNMKQIIS